MQANIFKAHYSNPIISLKKLHIFANQQQLFVLFTRPRISLKINVILIKVEFTQAVVW